MLKKILYAVIILGVIIILTIMWTDNKKEDILPIVTDQNSIQETTISTEEPTINDELDGIQVDAGIDAELNSIDADVKTL